MPTPRRGRCAGNALGVALALLGVALLAACASAPPSTTVAAGAPGRSTTAGMPSASHAPPAQGTDHRTFAPFDPGGAPIAGVTAHRSGYCWTSSITVADRDAYRCLAGNDLLDPCFAATATNAAATSAPSARVVDCYADPWSSAVQLRLTRSLPSPDGPLRISQPWAIELAGGTRCVVTSGTTTIVAGVAMRYRCPDATAGLLDPGAGLLQAEVRAQGGAAQRVDVRASWTA